MNHKKYKWMVGIDPGVQTGFALYNREKKSFVMIETTSIINALLYLYKYSEKESVLVRIEDARKRTWLPKEKNDSEYRGKLMGAGSVKRDSQIWEEFCLHQGIEFELVPPKNNKTKLDANLFSKYTGWRMQTSVHGRDAAMLVYGY
jgi:hypothetical protein